MNTTEYIVQTGATTDLTEIGELDRFVFGQSETPEMIDTKLRLHEDVHFALAKDRNKALVGYGIGYKVRDKYYL